MLPLHTHFMGATVYFFMLKRFDIIIIDRKLNWYCCGHRGNKAKQKRPYRRRRLFGWGISKTVSYKQNRIDIGGHRFFSKSDWVLDWWEELLKPCSLKEAKYIQKCMLKRKRLSRIYFESNWL